MYVAKPRKGAIYWEPKYDTIYVFSDESRTALIDYSTAKYLADASKLAQLTPEQTQIVASVRKALPQTAQLLLENSTTSDTNNISTAIPLYGIAATIPQLEDATLRASAQRSARLLEADLRSRQGANGG